MKMQVAVVALLILVAAVAAGPAAAQMAGYGSPTYPTTAAPVADGTPPPPPQPSPSPPPPPSPSPSYGGQPYSGQPYPPQPYPQQSYGGPGSPLEAAPSGPPPAEPPPGTFLNTYPEPGAYPPPGGPPAPAPVFIPAGPDVWVIPRWSFNFDVNFMQRSTTRSAPLFVDGSGQTVLNSQTDLNFPVECGFDLSAVCHFPSGWELEFGYFQVDGWVANNFVPNNSFVVVGNNETVPTIDTNAHYTSSIYLSEINLRRQVNEWLNLLIGFRGGELDEDYVALSNATTILQSAAAFESRTTNSLYGFQIGADVKLINTAPWHVNTWCKVGIYGNDIAQHSIVASSPGLLVVGGDPNLLSAELDGHASHLAFLGELGLAASYDFSSHFSARAFVQAVWISGVALAPEQIAGTNFDAGTLAISGDGSLFYYGGGLGLQLRF